MKVQNSKNALVSYTELNYGKYNDLIFMSSSLTVAHIKIEFYVCDWS
jgi:hypothetical protein